MDNKIRVIDLLNKIANGEDVPEKIRYENDILKYEEGVQDYFGVSKTGNGAFFNYLFVNKRTDKFINNTVEIIEEQQDIDIQEILGLDLEKYQFDITDEFAVDITLKINQLLDVVKQLDRNIKDKE